MPTNCVVECYGDSVHVTVMLTKAELLAELEARGVTNRQIMDALDLPSSRVSEIFNAIRNTGGAQRELTYDEGVKLLHAFGLEQDHQGQALPVSLLRLAVRHTARKLGVPASEDQIADLAKDLRAFFEYVANPKVRQSVEAAEGFFEALRLRHPAPEEEARTQSDPGTSR